MKAQSKKCPEWADPDKHAEVRKWEILENLCKRNFGFMFHTISILPESFNNQPCYCCGKPSTKRIWANIWGTATQFDVCKDHAFYHKRNVESVDKEI